MAQRWREHKPLRQPSRQCVTLKDGPCLASELEAQPARHRVVVDAVTGKEAPIGGDGAEAITDIHGNALIHVEGDAARQRRGKPVLVISGIAGDEAPAKAGADTVSYTHLRAHETPEH